MLTELGLVSSYHHYYGEAHGTETRPTFYLHRNKRRPYHIDYCFVPEGWASYIQSVQIGSYEDWQKHSDHRPLLVDLNLDRVVEGQSSPRL
jgi:endonuclease/exonuclease/phosphatase family metal-dependent hydrolase